MAFDHILRELYCEPAMITPDFHRVICGIVRDHISGAAHQPGGCHAQHGGEQSDPVQTRLVGDIAVVQAFGPMIMRPGFFERVSMGVTGTDEIAEEMSDMDADPHVGGVLLHIDSPGGSAYGVPELAAQIQAMSKPVVAYTDRIMASAAYYIAAGSSAIYASPSAVVGSIGVYSAFLDETRAYEMEGLKVELFKSGDYKGMGLGGTALTDDHRAEIQRLVDSLYADFAGFVRDARGADRSVMDGRVFRGQAAIDADLIDAVGTIDDAMAELLSLMEG